ncbi:hypothetical protein [Paramagnetospirillum kuznetsovii]|uniref:hypothetical protein n=1 Tax=Paramagnetospirillum kuznetsovii TaxID=2053833 RepID=UPI0011BF681E|nr:hypothetical protein [Paramagnetospirillum kuznetsovii]
MPIWKRLLKALRRQGLPMLLAPPALVAIAFDAWDFASLWVDHDHTVEETALQSQGVAREIGRSITSALQAIEVEATDHLTPLSNQYLEKKIRMPQLLAGYGLARQRLPQLASIHLYKADGRLADPPQLSRRMPPDISAIALFKAHRDGVVEQSVRVDSLEDLVSDQMSVKWQLVLAQSVRNAEGEFMGLMIASVDTEYFFSVIAEIRLAPGTAIRIFDSDGRLLLNHPRDFTQVGRNYSSRWTFQDWTQSKVELLGTVPDPTDNSPEIGVFRKVERYPILVSVGVAEDLALAEWWRELAILLVAILTFVAASLWSARRPLAAWVLHQEHHTDDPSGFRDGDGI